MRTTAAMTALFLAAVAGCGGSGETGAEAASWVATAPPAADVETAFEMTFDTSLPREQRPRVQWYDNTRCPTLCGAQIDSDGVATVGWHHGEKLSETDLALVLAQWLEYKMVGSFEPTPYQTAYRDQFTQRLRAVGL